MDAVTNPAPAPTRFVIPAGHIDEVRDRLVDAVVDGLDGITLARLGRDPYVVRARVEEAVLADVVGANTATQMEEVKAVNLIMDVDHPSAARTEENYAHVNNVVYVCAAALTAAGLPIDADRLRVAALAAIHTTTQEVPHDPSR